MTLARIVDAIRAKFDTPHSDQVVPEEVEWMRERVAEQQRRLELLKTELAVIRHEVEEAPPWRESDDGHDSSGEH